MMLVGSVHAKFSADTSEWTNATAKASQQLSHLKLNSEALTRTLENNKGVLKGYTAALTAKTAAAKAADQASAQLGNGLAQTQQTMSKAAAGISAMSGALGTADGKVGQFTTGIAAMTMAFASGAGPIAVLGVALGGAISLFRSMSADATKAADESAKALAKIEQKAKDAKDALAALAAGTSVGELQAARSIRESLTGDASKALASIGGRERYERVMDAGVNPADLLDAEKWKAAIPVIQAFDKAVETLADNKRAEGLASDIAQQQKAVDEANRKELELQGQLKAMNERATAASALMRDELDALSAQLGDTGAALASSGFGAAAVTSGIEGRSPFSGLETVSVDALERELAGLEGTTGDVVWSLAEYEAAQRRAIDAERARTAAISDGAAALGMAALNGSLGFGTIGSVAGGALGGGPAGAAAGQAIGDNLDKVTAALTEVAGRLVGESKGALAAMDASPAIGAIAALGVAASSTLLVLSLIIPVVGPLLAIIPLLTIGLSSLAAMAFFASTGTQAFADMSIVVSRAVQTLIEPLGMFWVNLFPLAGAFLQVAEAVAPVIAAFGMLTSFGPVVEVAVGALTLFAGVIMLAIETLGDTMKGIYRLEHRTKPGGSDGFRRWDNIQDSARAARKKLEDVNAASGAAAFGAALLVEDEAAAKAADENTRAIERNTRAIERSEMNLQRGYKVAGAEFAAAAPGTQRINLIMPPDVKAALTRFMRNGSGAVGPGRSSFPDRRN
jgi:hypothetical protein